MREQKNHNFRSSHSYKKHIVYAIMVVTIGIALQYGIFSVIGVRQKMKMFDRQVDANLLSLNENYIDSNIVDLYQKKVFLETRFQMSKNDSINLSLNLKDSLLQLEMKGVVIKSTKIIDFEVDQFLYHLKPATYQYLFGSQLQVNSYLSTISKAPIVIKKAPKYAGEALVSNAKIDSVKTEAVHWMLCLDKEIILKIEGRDQFSQSNWWSGHMFWWREDLNNFKKIKKAILFTVPEYHPEIRVVVSESEAKAIYRALPVKPFVGIRL